MEQDAGTAHKVSLVKVLEASAYPHGLEQVIHSPKTSRVNCASLIHPTDFKGNPGAPKPLYYLASPNLSLGMEENKSTWKAC